MYHGMGDTSSRDEEGEFSNETLEGQRIHGGKGNRRAKLVRFDQNSVSSTLELYGVAQDYTTLKQQCLEEGTLFEDSEFPAEESSVYFSGNSIGDIEWLRPSEIVDNPQFFVEGSSRFDVKQGRLGDCWLLAAIANLTLNPRLFHIVVPEDNTFSENYAGIFHFRFWQYGAWVDVVVDDKLPTQNGQLCFMHSDDSSEFWSALFEKAYAKLHGSYEALDGGLVCEALADFTGGITEMYNLNNDKERMFGVMERAQNWCSFMGCSLGTGGHSMESETSSGIIRGHAYSVTSLKRIETDGGTVNLVRLRNPWGNEKEWKGAWSDESEEWQQISDETKEEVGLTFDADGEFWMSYEDFSEIYDSLEICNLSGTDMVDGSGENAWKICQFEGSWIRGATAGGCRNYIGSFASNPQFVITLDTPDEDDEDGKCTVLVSLLQKNRRQMRKNGMNCLAIGYAIYSVPEEIERRPLPRTFFQERASVARSPTFINLREVCSRFYLDPGTYVIVPSTFQPNEEGDFLLRIFTETSADMKENDDEIGVGEVDESVVVDESDEGLQQLQNLFVELAGEDGDVDWKELKKLLDMNDSERKFSPDVCRSLMALMDKDMSGKLNFTEFLELIKNLVLWQKVFEQYDADKSGHLNSFELRDALGAAGYHVNQKVLQSLVLRYGDEDDHLQFNEFISCAIKLKATIDTFQKKVDDDHSHAAFTLEEWATIMLYS